MIASKFNHVESVHLWWADFSNVSDTEAEALSATLDDEETARAARFHYPHLRRRYRLSRGILRDILARYVRQAPSALEFLRNDYGKPFIYRSPKHPSVKPQMAVVPAVSIPDIPTSVIPSPVTAIPTSVPPLLQFNLSNTEDMLLLAVTPYAAVGVDIEAMSRSVDVLALADRFFSSAEQRALQQLPPTLQHAGFMAAWTRKEAVIKALGRGLSYSLMRFDVDVNPLAAEHDQHLLIQIEGDAEIARRWTVCPILRIPNYVAALAVQAQKIKLEYYQYGFSRC